MALGKQIKHYRDKLGWTLEKLSESTVGPKGEPVEVGTISALENRDSQRSIYAQAIAAAFGLTVEQLSDESTDYAVNGAGKEKVANTEPGPDLRGKVPLISWVAAGEWCNAADPHPPGHADRWMDCPVSHSSSTFALRVRGDSMTAPHGNSRTYPEGCYIFVDPEQRTPDNGDRVVACLTGTDEVTFKVYKNEDGRQWLQPLNPSHEPIREQFHILGTVLGKWEDG
jgi:SOS-response transcriptional repressor LexA